MKYFNRFLKSASLLACLPFFWGFGQIAPKEIQELPDPHPVSPTEWMAVQKGIHASFGSVDHRYAKHAIPQIKTQESLNLQAWRGERVSAQALIWAAEAIPNLNVEISPLKNKSSVIRANAVELQWVRYVMTDEFAQGCGYRKPEDFASSLSADILDPVHPLALEARSVQPLWISVDLPRDVRAGTYKAQLLVKSGAKTVKKLNLQVEVLAHTLPPASQWSYHLDLWQHPSAVARINGLKMWSDEHFEAMKPVMKRLASAGQKVITTTLNKDPWNVQTYDPYADMIIWTKKKDGSWSYNYDVFDRWVNLMMDLGIKGSINAYSMIPWNSTIHYYDEAKAEFVDVKAVAGTPEFIAYWSPFLEDFVDHLRTKGWQNITNIAMDERSPEEMEAAIQLIREKAPELGVAYADNHKSYKRFPESQDISIAVDHPYSREDLEQRRKEGKISTFYIYCGNEFPNTLTFSDPAEATYAAWYAEAAGFDGMLRWSYNSWVADPLQDSRFRTWPAGDTYIVYPGNRSSIRFERLLEGVQDYEKIQIIKKELQAKGDTNSLQKLTETIQKLNHGSRTEAWNENLNEAKKILNSF